MTKTGGISPTTGFRSTEGEIKRAVTVVHTEKDDGKSFTDNFNRIYTYTKHGLIYLFFLVAIFSCKERKITPIEKFKGMVFVDNNYPTHEYATTIDLKSKDSIFEVRVLVMDVKNLKAGDTIGGNKAERNNKLNK